MLRARTKMSFSFIFFFPLMYKVKLLLFSCSAYHSKALFILHFIMVMALAWKDVWEVFWSGSSSASWRLKPEKEKITDMGEFMHLWRFLITWFVNIPCSIAEEMRNKLVTSGVCRSCSPTASRREKQHNL